MNKYREEQAQRQKHNVMQKLFEEDTGIYWREYRNTDLEHEWRIKFSMWLCGNILTLESKLEQTEKEKGELDEKLTNILWNDEIGYKTKVYRCKNLLKQIE